MVTGAYTNLRPLSGVSSRYYNYFFLTLDTTKELLHLCTGLRNGLSKPTFFTLNLPVPDYETQERIADYLDEETALIDDLIAKQQRLLELLEEKRRATITNAVTRGLNSNAELKDTGIEWLGKIPAQWELKRLKYLFTVNDEALSQKTDPETEFDYVDISSVDKYEGITKREHMTFTSAPSRARRVVKDGDIILGAVRTYLEAIAQIKPKDEDVIVSTGFAVLRPEHTSDSVFYSWAIRSGAFMASVVASSDGVSYPAINADKLAALYMPLPPKDERDAISKYILDEMMKMDTLKAKIFDQIDLLKERRTSLISSAVTGKIKV
jgi:type I restriction enzyme S subunit